MSRKESTNHHSLRNSKGQFSSLNSSKADWTKPGALGFAHWIKGVQPRVLTSRNTYEVFKPTRKQANLIKAVLEVDDSGSFIHSLSLLIAPRRHGEKPPVCSDMPLVIYYP